MQPKATDSLPPLWGVMQQACDAAMAANHPLPTGEQIAAAEIRAVRDWILRLPNGYDWGRMQAEALARVLTAEADRAERGEANHD